MVRYTKHPPPRTLHDNPSFPPPAHLTTIHHPLPQPLHNLIPRTTLPSNRKRRCGRDPAIYLDPPQRGAVTRRQRRTDQTGPFRLRGRERRKAADYAIPQPFESGADEAEDAGDESRDGVEAIA